MFGQYPSSLLESDANPIAISRARLIPSTPWEGALSPSLPASARLPWTRERLTTIVPAINQVSGMPSPNGSTCRPQAWIASFQTPDASRPRCS